jgi:hypothetical protein
MVDSLMILLTQTLASINNAEPFQVSFNSTVPREILPPFLKAWSKRDPGKDGVLKPSRYSENYHFCDALLIVRVSKEF